jgi:hypothetical protein
MAVGEAGRGFTAELNRLANGGTYPVPTEFLEAQGAANKWAGLTGTNKRDIIGALNYKLDPNLTPAQYNDLNGVCNKLAGTTNTEPAAALRTIE